MLILSKYWKISQYLIISHLIADLFKNVFRCLPIAGFDSTYNFIFTLILYAASF